MITARTNRRATTMLETRIWRQTSVTLTPILTIRDALSAWITEPNRLSIKIVSEEAS